MNSSLLKFGLATLLISSLSSFAAATDEAQGPEPMGPAQCGSMEVWDFSEGMCQPLAMKGMPMAMLMVHGNGFVAQTFEEGPRGRTALAAPNMVMTDVGTSIGDRQYVNLDFMGTVERWTFPTAGYPELLQIGEHNQDGVAYIDAQHPHSSPVMGLTLSDTIGLGSNKDHLKISFAPRGQSTDGPVAFMHRVTGEVNPDAPLGHHIGQDVGHITSTVAAAALRLSSTTLEVSMFNGVEPLPANVDMPMDTLNSYAARLTQELSEHLYAMASVAFVKSPEPSEPSLDHVWRYSASIYGDHTFASGWMLHNTLIYGLVNNYDNVPALTSFNEEFLLHQGARNIWSRIEYLQRTAAELAVQGDASPNTPRWVTALTLGYTHDVISEEAAKIGVGASVTKDILPGAFRDAYGGDPLTAKVFLQASGMKMWGL